MAVTITAGAPLFQREIFNGVTSQGPVTIAGTYDGSPTSITVSIRKVADDTEVANGVDAAPAGGVYSITVADVPESVLANPSADRYYAHVTAAGTGDTASSKGVYQFHVGRIMLGIGQSNDVNRENTSSSPPAALDGTYSWHLTSGGWTPVVSGNGVRQLLNDLVTRFGVPWAYTRTSVGASNLDYFDPAGSDGYTATINRIAAVGGDIECIKFGGGESAAVATGNNVNRYPVAYAGLIDTIHNAIAGLANRTKAQCPMLINGLGRETSGQYGDVAWHRAQQCVRQAALVNEHIHYGHAQIDLPLGDDIHFSAAGHQTTSQREALAWAKVFGLETETCFYEVTAATVQSNTVTRVTMSTDQTFAGDFGPSSGITGFEASHDGVTWVSCTGVRVNATTIDLTHSSLPYPNRAIRFGYGDAPDMTSPPAETLYGAPPATSHVWAVHEQDANANPIIKIEELYQYAGTATQTIVSSSYGDPIAYGSDTEMYFFIAYNNSTVINSVTRNGASMTLVSSDVNTASGLQNAGYLFRHSDSALASVLTVNFAANPFRSPFARVFYRLAGAVSLLELFSDRALTTQLILQDVNIESGGLLFHVFTAAGGANSNQTFSGPSGSWTDNADGGYAIANATTETGDFQWDRPSATSLTRAIVSLAAPIVVSQDAGTWEDVPGATSTTLVTNVPGQYRYVASGFTGEVTSNTATISNS